MHARRLVIVGAGLTAASVVARLRQLQPRAEVVVIDVRPHVGGNCYDERNAAGTRVHRYGPHVFHSPSERIVEFLSCFTGWTPYHHEVTAEVEFEGRLSRVPFPYSRATADALGRLLTAEQIVDVFFRGYSRKMWGQPWESLASSVRKRVPTNDRVLPDRPVYFPKEFVAMPTGGYTAMIERMFEGATLRLGAGEQDWLGFEADHVIYTGRPDRIPLVDDAGPSAPLPFRSLDIRFSDEPDWPVPTAVLNLCHERVPHTRQTCYRLLTGGNAMTISTEVPREAAHDELAPFYPIAGDANRERYQRLHARIAHDYSKLTLAGRLGTYQYFDMYQAVGHGIALAERLAH